MSSLVQTIVRATEIPVPQRPEPFVAPAPRKQLLIIGSMHLNQLSDLLTGYAVDASILIPVNLPELDREHEVERAVQFEVDHEKSCRMLGCDYDLSNTDPDCADILMISTPYPLIREQMLRHAWKVTREFGKVLVYSSSMLPTAYLASFGVVNPTYYMDDGLYVGTLRKSAAMLACN